MNGHHCGNAKARGSFFGLSHIHTRADVLRAVMEGIQHEYCNSPSKQYGAFSVGEPAQVLPQQVALPGSKVWRQMLADILNSRLTFLTHLNQAALDQ